MIGKTEAGRESKSLLRDCIAASCTLGIIEFSLLGSFEVFGLHPEWDCHYPHQKLIDGHPCTESLIIVIFCIEYFSSYAQSTEEFCP